MKICLIFILLIILSSCSGNLSVSVHAVDKNTVDAWKDSVSTRDSCLQILSKTPNELADPILRDVLLALDIYKHSLLKRIEIIKDDNRLTYENRNSYENILLSSIRSLPDSKSKVSKDLLGGDWNNYQNEIIGIQTELKSKKTSDICNANGADIYDVVVRQKDNQKNLSESAAKLISDLVKNVDFSGTSNETKSKLNAETKSSDAKVTKVISELESSCTELVCGGYLDNSEYASFLSSLPKDKWGNEFNYATAKGKNGNVDIVIKMTHKADFTVKGMRFDAKKVAEVTRKGLIQSLGLVAALSGYSKVSTVMTPSSTTGAPPTDLNLNNQAYSDELTIATRNEIIKARYETLKQFGLIISSNINGLTNENDAITDNLLEGQLTNSSDIFKLSLLK